MEKYFKKFLLKILITAAILIVLGVAILHLSDALSYDHAFLFVLLIYTAFIGLVQFFLYKYAQKPMAVFNRAFMLITAGKLMTLIIFMLILAITVPDMFKYFLGELLLIYIIYSIVEIKDILSYIKSINSR